MRNPLRSAFCTVITVALMSGPGGPIAAADSTFAQEFATSEVLPERDGQQWFWIYGMRSPNQTDSRGFLMDENGQQLGQLSTGFWSQSLIPARSRGEIITLETYLSRGTRGERTDLVVIYDERTLAPKTEIVIPPKRINAVRPGVTAALSDDEKFLLVVNYTPAQSVTIVDLNAGTVIEEVETPGCSTVFAAGNRDFYAICGNGGFMHLGLNDAGRVETKRRTEPMFDAVNDFLTVSASRAGNTWYFVSRQNNIYSFTMEGDQIERNGTWPLVTEAEREDGWMIAGMQHTAVHESSSSLYVLVQQALPEHFEDPGSAVWVFDTSSMEKRLEIEMEELTTSIAVSSGSNPRLYTLDMHFPIPALATIWMALSQGESSLIEVLRQRANVYDASTGEHLLSSSMIPSGFVSGIRAW